MALKRRGYQCATTDPQSGWFWSTQLILPNCPLETWNLSTHPNVPQLNHSGLSRLILLAIPPWNFDILKSPLVVYQWHLHFWLVHRDFFCFTFRNFLQLSQWNQWNILGKSHLMRQIIPPPWDALGCGPSSEPRAHQSSGISARRTSTALRALSALFLATKKKTLVKPLAKRDFAVKKQWS